MILDSVGQSAKILFLLDIEVRIFLESTTTILCVFQERKILSRLNKSESTSYGPVYIILDQTEKIEKRRYMKEKEPP